MVREEGAVMIDIILATLMGLLVVIAVAMIPILFVSRIFDKIDMDMDADNNNINNNQEENGNN